ncbi:PiggyBac transposable element-derived protein 4 [Cucumispora dikerogammari]|nr:PiggyBac transposable element-derived protein 4 [Cucumispora dikerogammari]
MNFEPELTEGRKMVNKPLMIKDYDANMGGVDKYNQMLKTYFNERKSVRWTNKLAVYLINLMTHNSYVLYKEFFSAQNRLTKHLTFLKEIIKCLAEGETSNRLKKEKVIKGHLAKKSE